MIPYKGDISDTKKMIHLDLYTILILERTGIVKQCGNNGRNRIFEHTDLNSLLVDTR